MGLVMEWWQGASAAAGHEAEHWGYGAGEHWASSAVFGCYLLLTILAHKKTGNPFCTY